MPPQCRHFLFSTRSFAGFRRLKSSFPEMSSAGITLAEALHACVWIGTDRRNGECSTRSKTEENDRPRRQLCVERIERTEEAEAPNRAGRNHRAEGARTHGAFLRLGQIARITRIARPALREYLAVATAAVMTQTGQPTLPFSNVCE